MVRHLHLERARVPLVVQLSVVGVNEGELLVCIYAVRRARRPLQGATHSVPSLQGCSGAQQCGEVVHERTSQQSLTARETFLNPTDSRIS